MTLLVFKSKAAFAAANLSPVPHSDRSRILTPGSVSKGVYRRRNTEYQLFADHDFVVACSRTDWSRQGYRVRVGEEPVGTIFLYRIGHYDIYGPWQVEPKRSVACKPAAVLSPDRENILRAIYSVNRSAKRYRDGASESYNQSAHSMARRCREQKERLYNAKDRGIAYGYTVGWLKLEGIHGGLVLYSGSGYYFHSTLLPSDTEFQVSDQDGEAIFVEAKPRGINDLRLKDAVATLEALPETQNDFIHLDVPKHENVLARSVQRDGSYYDEAGGDLV